MTLAEINTVLNEYKKGTMIHLSYKRECKTLKEFKHVELVKFTTSGKFRLGIDYDHLKQTIERREIGESPTENQGLPWGKYVVFPFLIEHKGTYYLRAYVKLEQVNTMYFLNGKPAKKSEISHMLLASEKTSTDLDTLTLTIKIDNILSIG